MGILAEDGVVLVAEKKITSKVRVARLFFTFALYAFLSTDMRDLVPRIEHLMMYVMNLDRLSAGVTFSVHQRCVLSTLTNLLRATLQLLDSKAVGVKREKMYQFDNHIACSVAGITSDANILISTARLIAQVHQCSAAPGREYARHVDKLISKYTRA